MKFIFVVFLFIRATVGLGACGPDTTCTPSCNPSCGSTCSETCTYYTYSCDKVTSSATYNLTKIPDTIGFSGVPDCSSYNTSVIINQIPTPPPANTTVSGGGNIVKLPVTLNLIKDSSSTTWYCNSHLLTKTGGTRTGPPCVTCPAGSTTLPSTSGGVACSCSWTSRNGGQGASASCTGGGGLAGYCQMSGAWVVVWQNCP